MGQPGGCESRSAPPTASVRLSPAGLATYRAKLSIPGLLGLSAMRTLHLEVEADRGRTAVKQDYSPHYLRRLSPLITADHVPTVGRP